MTLGPEDRGLPMRTWLAHAIRERISRGEIIEVLTAWPLTVEATRALVDARDQETISEAAYQQITSHRLVVEPGRWPGYDGRLNRVRVLNGVLDLAHQPFQCGRRRALGGAACWLHGPSSDNPTVSWPVHWWDTAREVSRVCMHWTPHPDPDDEAYRVEQGRDRTPHECICGCCR